ncbi:MAG: isopeptide-forming domain-containing fimbrial protein [Streptococcaceae bacterium]|jgi:fimbrial isopeptide formation D2 family protein|nr:isopeptide-forming domain-containing fimbrial protein [Streptococcaceae bacterium]
MKKKNFNSLIILFIFLQFLFVMINMPKRVLADSETIDVTLHKYQSSDEYLVDDELIKQLIAEGTTLAGAYFTAYDISKQYYTLLNENLPNTAMTNTESYSQQILDKIIKDIWDNQNIIPSSFEAKSVARCASAADGTAVFSGLDKRVAIQLANESSATSREAVYVFVENSQAMTSIAQPTTLAIPASDVNATSLDTVHLYPKNLVKTNQQILLNKADFGKATINEIDYPNVTTKDVLKYQLTVTVPTNIGDTSKYAGFKLVDLPDVGLTLADEPNLVVQDENLAPLVEYSKEAGTAEYDYIFERINGAGEDAGKQGFSITFKYDNGFTPAVKALAGKKLTLTYELCLTEKVMPDKLLTNEAYLAFKKTEAEQFSTITPSIRTEVSSKVITAGKQFLAYDARLGKKSVLSGAVFSIFNQAGDKAKFKLISSETGDYYYFAGWNDSENSSPVTQDETEEVISGQDGYIRIVGLEHSKSAGTLSETNATNYVINEIRPPQDNKTRYTPITGQLFTVNYSDYLVDGENDSALGLLPNVPKGYAPRTWAIDLVPFLAVGVILLMICALYRYRSVD